MIKTVVIFGGHIQALGLARQVQAAGVEAVLAVSERFAVASFSRAVSRTARYASEAELWAIIQEYKSSEKEVLLFPTNDESVEFLVKRYEELNCDFFLGIPKPETVKLFANKRNTYRFAEKNGIDCPKSWYPDTMEEVWALADELTYPVVLKPAIMYSFHKEFGKKAFRCDSAGELIAVASRVSARFPLRDVLVQEFLVGGAKVLYSYGAFAVNGKPQAALMANRIRQNPMDFGNSTTFAVTCNIRELREAAERILSLTGYFGLGEVEFMYDEARDSYRFLEINTRAWKWHTISNRLDFAFIAEMIRHFNGEKRSPKLDFDKRVGWVERLTDWTVAAKEIMKRRMSWREFIRSYRIEKECAVWSWRDPLPAVMYVLLSPILYFIRH